MILNCPVASRLFGSYWPLANVVISIPPRRHGDNLRLVEVDAVRR
jgi:hypothetical protein